MNLGANLMAGLGLIAGVGLVTLMPVEATAATAPSAGVSVSSPPPGTSSVSPAAEQAMARAHRVAVLQEALNSTGANLAVDGVWGPATERALEHYQRQADLQVTGRLDHATWARLDPIG